MESRKRITLISFIILVAYNIIALLIPNIKNTTFWVAYGFSNLSIIVASLVILGVLDKQGIKSKFHNMPMVYAACTYLILQLILGFVEIYHPINFRYSILMNVILLGIYMIILVGVNAGKKEIERVEQKVQEKVFFIKEWQADIETFADKITDLSAKKELNLLAEIIRYSDPMSHSNLATLENQISTKIQTLMQQEDNETIKQNCTELQQLFAERNRKAKLYKSQPEQVSEEQKPLNFKLITAIIVSLFVLIAIAVTVYFTVVVPNKQYNEAVNLYNQKEYLQAIEAFEKLEDYKDSEKKQKEAIYAYATQLFEEKDYSNAVSQFLKLEDYKDAKDKVIEIYNLFGESDVIYFGEYNGVPIGWQILQTDEHKVLLITKEIIDEMAYHTEYKSVDWENSSIRKWLNEDFYDNFDEKEKAKILKNSEETDKVFLLSIESIGSYTELKKINTSWWIKSAGEDTTKAMYVTEIGAVNKEGDVVTKLHGVRPAIWLDLD